MKNSLIFCIFIVLLNGGCESGPSPKGSPLDNPKIERSIVNAEILLQKGQLEEAEGLINQVQTKTWKTQAIRGDIAAHRKQWQIAAQFFKQSLELTKKAHLTTPKVEEIEDIYESLQDVQLLAGEMTGPLMPPPKDSAKSIWFKPMPIPVQFKFGGYKINDITEKGKKSVRFIADYINMQNAEHVILYGHTDERGDAIQNQRISEQRAKSVRTYLQNDGGVRAKIDVIGKGEDEPLPLPRWKINLTQEEIYQRNRRVELKILD